MFARRQEPLFPIAEPALDVCRRLRPLAAGLALVLVAACEPRVAIEAPKEPITINLNIKLDADVRLRIEEQAKDDVRTAPIF
ncbi:MAG: YnbE family lipoprotein [Alphaproteobacteria bacterium]